MPFDVTRIKFIEYVGKEKYKDFVLTLFEAFPIRDRLFLWQEQLLVKFSSDLNLPSIKFEDVYSIFNHCPIHDIELKEDTVPIIDGSNIKSVIPYEKQLEISPMANVDAPRNLEMQDYPESVEVFYCFQCRVEREKNYTN